MFLIKKIKNKILNLSVRTKFTALFLAFILLQGIFLIDQFKKNYELENKVNENFNVWYMVGTFSQQAKFEFARFDAIILELGHTKSLMELKNQLIEADEKFDNFHSALKVVRERSREFQPLDTKIKTLMLLTKKISFNLEKLKEKIGKGNLKGLASNLHNQVIPEDEKDEIYELLGELSDVTSQEAYINRKDILTLLHDNYLYNSVVSLALLLLFAISYWYFSSSVVLPIVHMSKIFQEISNGNRKKDVEITGIYSEVRDLAISFNDLKYHFNQAILREESANRALSRFLANMGHELRTPLNAILGFAEALKMEKAIQELPGEKSDWPNMIASSGKHLLELINDLLDLSKLQSSHFEISESTLSLRKLVSSSIPLLFFRAEERNVEMKIHFSDPEDYIFKGDETRIKQILINLVGNSIKFSENGKVTITVGSKNITDNLIEILFEIQDTGIGISKEKIGKIFEAFAQADNAISKQYGGTGLGLSICKNLVERMNGKIWVNSEIGKGSTFSFTLKLPFIEKAKIEDDKETKSNFEQFEHPELNNCRILLVEDNLINQKVFRALTQGIGLEDIEILSDGIQLIEKEDFKTYDLIFLDLQMPQMGGLEAMSELKKRKVELPPVIALTAQTSKEDRENCLKAGMKDFLTKPVKRESLLKIILKYAIVESGQESAS